MRKGERTGIPEANRFLRKLERRSLCSATRRANGGAEEKTCAAWLRRETETQAGVGLQRIALRVG
jgi:hypothetical protein